MSRVRTFLAFLGGLLVALLVGLVPAEVFGWFRGSAGHGESEASPDSTMASKRRRARRRRIRSN